MSKRNKQKDGNKKSLVEKVLLVTAIIELTEKLITLIIIFLE